MEDNMRRLAYLLDKYLVPTLLSIILIICVYGIFIKIDNNKLKEQNTELKVKVSELETNNKDLNNLVIERNNEIYRLKMIAEEWKELFYTEIDFHPYEGPEW
jgi:cell division protein FtsL